MLTIPIVTHYLGENESSNFYVFNNWYLFYFHKTVLVLKPNLTILQKYTRKMLKMHVAVWHHTYFWVLLRYLITNHTTGAIKSVVHVVNMKFRKLKKNYVRYTITELDNWNKKCSNCPPWALTQACSVAIENKKSLVEIKLVHRLTNTWTFWQFHQGSVRTHIRRGMQYTSYIVRNLFRCHCAKNYRNRLTFD